MPKLPAASPKPKRRARGESYWLMQVAACGNHCCAPGCPNSGPLEQGHIESYGDGFGDDPENLIPLCRSCNFKYQKIRTPDGRPKDWRERLIQLLGYAIQPKLMVVHQNSWFHTIPATDTPENKDIIRWPKPEFALGTGVFTPSNSTRKRAVAMVEKIKRLSREKIPAPNLPTGPRNDTLVKFAESYATTFERTCREFLLRKDFLRDDGSVRDDSWRAICDNWMTYERWAEERVARDAAIAAKQVAEAAKSVEQAKRDKLEREWTEYQRVIEVKAWPGMTDDDKVFIERVAAEKAANARPESPGVTSLAQALRAHAASLAGMREVTGDELARCRAIVARRSAYDRQLLAKNRNELTATIAKQFELLKKVKHNEDHEEWHAGLFEAAKSVRDATTLAQLESQCGTVQSIASEY